MKTREVNQVILIDIRASSTETGLLVFLGGIIDLTLWQRLAIKFAGGKLNRTTSTVSFKPSVTNKLGKKKWFMSKVHTILTKQQVPIDTHSLVITDYDKEIVEIPIAGVPADLTFSKLMNIAPLKSNNTAIDPEQFSATIVGPSEEILMWCMQNQVDFGEAMPVKVLSTKEANAIMHGVITQLSLHEADVFLKARIYLEGM